MELAVPRSWLGGESEQSLVPSLGMRSVLKGLVHSLGLWGADGRHGHSGSFVAPLKSFCWLSASSSEKRGHASYSEVIMHYSLELEESRRISQGSLLRPVWEFKWSRLLASPTHNVWFNQRSCMLPLNGNIWCKDSTVQQCLESQRTGQCVSRCSLHPLMPHAI